MRRFIPLGLGLCVWVFGFAFHASAIQPPAPAPAAAAAKPDGKAPVSFLKDLAPIFVESCTACHNTRKAESKYDMTTFTKLSKGGRMSEGLEMLAAGKPEDSFFVELILPDAQPLMPYKQEPLVETKRALIERWVKEGAKYDGASPDEDWTVVYRKNRPVTIPEAYPMPVPITALAWTPDGAEVLASGFHEITAWKVADGKLTRRIGGLRERVQDLAVSADGKWLASAGGDPGLSGAVHLWILDAAGGKLVREVLDTTDSVHAVKFSPDSAKLAAAGADRTIRSWETATGKELAKIEDHADWVFDIAFSPDGKFLASASRDKTSKVFDLVKKESLVTFPGHGDAVYGVGFTSDGKNVITSGGDARIRIWDPNAEAKEVRNIGGFGGPVFRIRVSPDGSTIAGCSSDAKVRLVKTADGAVLKTLEGHKDWVYSLAFSPDGTKLATGSWDGEIKIWNLADGKVLQSLIAAPGRKIAAQ